MAADPAKIDAAIELALSYSFMEPGQVTIEECQIVLRDLAQYLRDLRIQLDSAQTGEQLLRDWLE